jgi:hypothetical protein
MLLANNGCGQDRFIFFQKSLEFDVMWGWFKSFFRAMHGGNVRVGVLQSKFTSTKKQGLQRGRGVMKSFSAFLTEISVWAVEHESWEVGRKVVRDRPKQTLGGRKMGSSAP